MKIYVKYNNKYIGIQTGELEMIGEGYEGIVYSYNDIAIKVKRGEYALDYNDVIKFKKIDTERILLPKSPIYRNKFKSKNNYIGYTTKLIHPKEKKELININSNTLYTEISKLIEDVNRLTEERIVLCDLDNIDNFVYDGSLYFVDPGCYEYSKSLTKKEIFSENFDELGYGLLINVFNFGNKLDYIKEELVKIFHFKADDLTENVLENIFNIYYEYHMNNFKKSNNFNQAYYMLNILEKYGSLQKYKYELLKQYVRFNINNSETYNVLKKTL